MTETKPDTTHRPAARALRAAMAEPWAITAEGLELVLSIAAREHDVSIKALEAYRARHVPQAERMTMRGSVAVLEVNGPLFRRANIFTAISGATSYDVLRRDLQTGLDDAAIKAIMLSFDTPGGEVTGVAELGDAIREARAKKPIIAYVGGAAASAGYWLASQASEIVVAETAVLGSIGVRAVLQDTSAKDREQGRHEFISSQSPGKRADLASDEGRARVQRTVDALAAVFIGAVAKGRNVSADHVAARFGQGDVLIGQAAVARGLADRLGSFEAVLAGLTVEAPSARPEPRRATREIAAVDRIKAILESPEAIGREAFARHVALNSPMTAPEAIALLKTVPTAGTMPAPKAPAPLMPVGPFPAQRAIVATYPPGAALPMPGKTGKAAWGNVLAKMTGAKS